jgi:hypothetical protein
MSRRPAAVFALAKSIPINIIGPNVTPQLGTGTTITEG